MMKFHDVTAILGPVGLAVIAAFAPFLSGCNGCGKPKGGSDAGGPVEAGALGERDGPDYPKSLADAALPPPDKPGLEARITVRMESPRLAVNEEHTFDVKGDRARFSMPAERPTGPAPLAIADVTAGKLYKRRDAELSYSVFPLYEPEFTEGYDGGAWIAKATDKKDTVAGLACEVWELSRGVRHATVCLAPGIAFVDFTRMTKRLPRLSWAEVVAQKGMFPLRIEERDEAREIALRAFVIHADKQTFPPGHFAIAGDYRQVAGVPPPKPPLK